MKTKKNPIVLANTEWMPPDWLLQEVKVERMIMGLCAMMKPDQFNHDSDYVSDIECLSYMMPATGRAPLNHEATQIYLYLATRVMKRVKNIDVPKDIKVTKLSEYHMGELKKLKSWIFDKRNGKVNNPVLNALDEVFGKKTKQLSIF